MRRVDHASGWFVKGNLGAGGVFNGTLNDEDFPAFGARQRLFQHGLARSRAASAMRRSMSATHSSKRPAPSSAPLSVTTSTAEQLLGHGCTQLVDGDSCFGVDPNYLIISNDDQYNSMRVGLSAEFMLTDRLKFTADAAYVPLVNMTGVDDHNARGGYFPETDSAGYGTMMEAFFSYNVTDHWDVGAGGRYWAWTMRHGTSGSRF